MSIIFYKFFISLFYISYYVQMLRVFYGFIVLTIEHYQPGYIFDLPFFYKTIENFFYILYLEIYPVLIFIVSLIVLIVNKKYLKVTSTFQMSHQIRSIVPLIVWTGLFKMLAFLIFIVFNMQYDRELWQSMYPNGVFHVASLKFFILTAVEGIVILYLFTYIYSAIIKNKQQIEELEE